MELINLYIPPINSTYYDEQSIGILGSMYISAEENETPLIAIGDLNAHFGELQNITTKYSYSSNPDKSTNENGNFIKDIIFEQTTALPLNHLETTDKKFEGGFTFTRGEHQSQIDWTIVNSYSLPLVADFKIHNDCPKISDHFPISVQINTKYDSSLDTIIIAAKELNKSVSNHSSIPIINSINNNLTLLHNLMKQEVKNLNNINQCTSTDIADFLYNKIHMCGKISRNRILKIDTILEEQNEQNNLLINNCRMYHVLLENEENKKWEFINNCNDSKLLWSSINMKGEIKEDQENDIQVEELASHFTAKSKIEIEQALYDDLTTDIKNDDLDKEITDQEINEAVNKLNTNSKTSDGISTNALKTLLPTIMNLFIILLNLIFVGGKENYPNHWLSFINAIPKKGQLKLPKFVRYISVMGIFEKVYQTILNNRLYNFIKIPSQQSAYQKGKGCQLHVMTIRLLKALTKKRKRKLYITFTDFEAAFDLVSRRLLFKKLITLGISSIMLTALMAIYLSSKSVIQHKGEFSDYLILLTGIKQGAPTSGILYIIYTAGIIDLFNKEFNAEPLIGMLHLLMHADDILMLASTKQKAKEKLMKLMKYSNENFIKLQLTKCSIMCVNSKDSDDHEALITENITLKNVSKETYLGSVITNSHKLLVDVKEDIKHRNFNIIKYYAFLRENNNAPIHIKIKALNSCIIASILHNCETWANSNLQQLEVKYRRILKCILGVSQSTCSELLFVELPVLPISTQVKIKQYNFWKKVDNILVENDPLRVTINEARRGLMEKVTE